MFTKRVFRLSIVVTMTLTLPFSFPAAESLARAGEIEERSCLPDPVTDSSFYDNGAPDPNKVKLGNLLFYDKILSGNKNISCATCHHSLTDTGDGWSLPVGEGARGLGVTRDLGTGDNAIHERVPRNSPPIFNLGWKEFSVMFHDGRVEVDPTQPSGYRTPAGDDLPLGLDNVLAAQAMFPVTSPPEMAGQEGENWIADAAAAGNLPLVWKFVAERLRDPDNGYVDMFIDVFPDVNSAADITYVHAANAIAAFEAYDWRFDNSPFDRRLRGDFRAMSRAATRGMWLFYGRAGCAGCHSGPFQTDLKFHAIAMPQIGPGKGDNAPGYADDLDDFGRERVTGYQNDRYRFRTPPLRNVALTGPWGHAGTYSTLEGVVTHNLHPRYWLEHYDTSQAILANRKDLAEKDFAVQNDPIRRSLIGDANELRPVWLTKWEVADLIEFLHALTDPAAVDLWRDMPKAEEIPSGLPLYD